MRTFRVIGFFVLTFFLYALFEIFYRLTWQTVHNSHFVYSFCTFCFLPTCTSSLHIKEGTRRLLFFLFLFLYIFLQFQVSSSDTKNVSMLEAYKGKKCSTKHFSHIIVAEIVNVHVYAMAFF